MGHIKMPPKKRNKENTGLPARWRWKDGAYRYRVPSGQEDLWEGKTEFKLSKSYPEALRVWANRLEIEKDAESVGDLLEAYQSKVIPQKSLATQERENRLIYDLIKVFGHMNIHSFKAKHAYQIKTKIGESRGEATANRMISIMSHAYTMAIEWGLIDQHPIKGNVIKYGPKSRNRYVEDWELEEALTVASKLVKAYVPIKQLTGLRKGDILSIKLSDLKEDGIHVTQNKTGKKIIIEWTDELLEAIEYAKSIRKKIVALWLFHTNVGQPYIKEDRTTSGFNSVWQRWQQKAINETDLVMKFAESDLRAKTASDTSEDHATDLLDHSSKAVTQKHYRRKPKVVRPHTFKSK